MSAPTVAILGASNNRSKFGNISVRAHRQQGYDVFPVNPRGEPIEGLTTYTALKDIPAALDRISVYLPPARLLEALPEIASTPHRELYFNPGTESAEVLQRAEELGLAPISACSIVELGISPSDVT